MVLQNFVKLTNFPEEIAKEHESRNASDENSVVQGSGSSIASPSTTPPASPPLSSITSSSKSHPTMAYKYCLFYQTARRWRIGYEQNEKQRSISMQFKGKGDGPQADILFESAKIIFNEYLAVASVSNEANTNLPAESDLSASSPKIAPSKTVTTLSGFVLDSALHSRLRASMNESNPSASQSPTASGKSLTNSAALQSISSSA